jgi:hypothetical protein
MKLRPSIGSITTRRHSVATTLSIDEMKTLVRRHFEDFVNNKKAEVIHKNMTPDFYDHDGLAQNPPACRAMRK